MIRAVLDANVGDAEYVVSGDQHLLQLATYQRIKILAPREFLEVLTRPRIL